MSVCDAVVAVEGARFALTETRLGIIPATIAPYVIARLGEGRARSVFFSGRAFEPRRRAPRAGDPGGAGGRARRRGRGGGRALFRDGSGGGRRERSGWREASGAPIDEGVVEATIASARDAWETAEAREGIAAFLKKRPPPWADS